MNRRAERAACGAVGNPAMCGSAQSAASDAIHVNRTTRGPGMGSIDRIVGFEPRLLYARRKPLFKLQAGARHIAARSETSATTPCKDRS